MLTSFYLHSFILHWIRSLKKKLILPLLHILGFFTLIHLSFILSLLQTARYSRIQHPPKYLHLFLLIWLDLSLLLIFIIFRVILRNSKVMLIPVRPPLHF